MDEKKCAENWSSIKYNVSGMFNKNVPETIIDIAWCLVPALWKLDLNW